MTNLDFLLAWWSQDKQSSSMAAGFPDVKTEVAGLSLKSAPYHIFYFLSVKFKGRELCKL